MEADYTKWRTELVTVMITNVQRTQMEEERNMKINK